MKKTLLSILYCLAVVAIVSAINLYGVLFEDMHWQHQQHNDTIHLYQDSLQYYKRELVNLRKL
ncbi:hypothetical protein BWI93_05280 [Siphonobacter sp. BAB-5385]|uniref:hypothetical protein n=1 Tax=Siphonobacter sp. BAB-5385 TaxID=1864822 RepID=UPI000B9E777A|nr:hypothetical protein [Siphonobacter sp. BAB-5385]OZI09159.1 hypothetical protein BWI93_05280 [Siphonobacter sp. BAB-5385]